MQLTNHIVEKLLDQVYARAVCGVILDQHPKLPMQRYGFLDWKPNVNCQGCLKTAWAIMEHKRQEAKLKTK